VYSLKKMHFLERKKMQNDICSRCMFVKQTRVSLILNAKLFSSALFY